MANLNINGTIKSTGGGTELYSIDIESIGANYIRYNNGIQICWGKISSLSGNSQINLPKAFVNTNYNVVWGFNRNSSTNVTLRVMSAHDKTTTAFYTYCLAELEKEWFAIGQWK